MGYLLLAGFLMLLLAMVWWLTSDHSYLDDILRERADYDVWLRRNALSEQKERELERRKDVSDHQKRMVELQKEVDKLERLMKK